MLHSQNPADVLDLSVKDLGKDFKLARNFALWEFQCSDGSDNVKIHPSGIILLQTLSDDVAKDVGERVPITITSAFRTLSYNREIGSDDTSYHPKGMAWDIVVGHIKWDIDRVEQWALSKGVGGNGYYPTTKKDGKVIQIAFNHLDVGPKRRWKG